MRNDPCDSALGRAQGGVGDDVARDLCENDVPVECAGCYSALLGQRAEIYRAEVADAARKGATPVFRSLHFTEPHRPWVGPGDEAASRELDDLLHYDGGNLGIYASMARALDATVGRLLRTLTDLGLRDDTVAVFTCDKGRERYTCSRRQAACPTLRIRVMARTSRRCSAASRSPDAARFLALQGARPAGRSRWRFQGSEELDNECLFDFVRDERERANLKERKPVTFARVAARRREWDRTQLPITAEVFRHGFTRTTRPPCRVRFSSRFTASSASALAASISLRS
jgi:hypothetical protein